MKHTRPYYLFELKINTLKVTSNYLNTLINEGIQLLDQYPDFLRNNTIFYIRQDENEKDITLDNLNDELVKLIFLNLMIYFEEYIKFTIGEIINQYNVNHIGYMSNILKTNYENWYKFLGDVFKDNSFKMSIDIRKCIKRRNDIVHSNNNIHIFDIPSNVKNEKEKLILKINFLKKAFDIVETEAKRINEKVINGFPKIDSY